MKIIVTIYFLFGLLSSVVMSMFLIDMIDGRQKGLTTGTEYHTNTDNGAIGIISMLLCMSIFFVIIGILFFKSKTKHHEC